MCECTTACLLLRTFALFRLWAHALDLSLSPCNLARCLGLRCNRLGDVADITERCAVVAGSTAGELFTQDGVLVLQFLVENFQAVNGALHLAKLSGLCKWEGTQRFGSECAAYYAAVNAPFAFVISMVRLSSRSFAFCDVSCMISSCKAD